MIEFTIQNFFELKEFIYEKIGITFKENKFIFLKRRVLDEIKKHNFNSFEDYFHYLKYRDFDEKMLRSLTSKITINETYFFREFDQLAIFGENILNDYLGNKMLKKDYNLNILSAGCSIGAEPYTIGIILNEMIDNINLWNIKIKGIDIDEKALEVAQKGIYNKYYLRETADYYKNKYFDIFGKDEYRIKENVKKLVDFERVNLIDFNKLRSFNNFDFIFCRNVLIYFDEKNRKRIVETFYLLLNNGGFLFLGHSESVARITSAFNLKRVENYILYYK